MIRYLPDGSVIFPQKGLPPEELAGFIVDSSDPYRFLPDIHKCKFRKIELVTLVGCAKGCEKTIMTCTLKEIPVSQSYCQQCTDYKND